jgi:branched-chain amino acid aminotransferase
MKITKVAQSRLGDVDYRTQAFGALFTDHMVIADYKDGKWSDPEIVPYGPMTMDPSSSVFHYGQALFEGMKAYKDRDGNAFLFRPDQNIKRFNRSCERLAIPTIDEEAFLTSLRTLIALDRNWIPEEEGSSLYVRPFVFATEAAIKANPSMAYRFCIICAPVASYFSEAIAVKIEERFSRAAPGGFGYAKAAGNYAGQFYPTELAKAEGYQQVIWTDALTHQYIEEAGTMNIFVRFGDTLVTSPISDTILDGITRKSMIQLCKDLSIKVEERPIAVQELLDGFQNGELIELFGAGTAAVVSEIKSFGYRGVNYGLDAADDSYGARLKKALTDIQRNRAEDIHQWRYPIKADV